MRREDGFTFGYYTYFFNTDDSKQMAFFKNGPFPASFSFYLFLSFQYSLQLTMFNIIFKWLDLNCGTLVSEATTLPTEPQPLPKSLCKIMTRLIYLIHSVII